MKIISFVKNWVLPLSMLAGACAYFLFVGLHLPSSVHEWANECIAFIQPFLVFAMLFLSFCKVPLRELRPCRWHLWLLLIQLASFVLLAGLAICYQGHPGVRLLIEGAMLCMVCPTATAAVVITSKLGGNAARLVSYSLLINFAVALVIPFVLPFLYSSEGVTFTTSFFLILGKVFPLLVSPLFFAWFVRRYFPRLHQSIMRFPDLAFYLWSASLSLCIIVTCKSIVHSSIPSVYIISLALVSLVCCFVQFALGKRIGQRYGDKICAGQALGQKNTVFAIWLGYTFLNPVTALAGGFYILWHNSVNSWQLYQMRKQGQKGPRE